MMWVGLLCLETPLAIWFYVFPWFYVALPQFQVGNAPQGHWEMETPLRDSPWLWAALIAFYGVLILGNVGLIIVIWRRFKDLKLND